MSSKENKEFPLPIQRTKTRIFLNKKRNPKRKSIYTCLILCEEFWPLTACTETDKAGKGSAEKEDEDEDE